MVTGVPVSRTAPALLLAIGCAALAAVGACSPAAPDGQIIAVDTATTRQTMAGWEATGWISQWACPPDTSPVPAALPFYRDTLIDMAADLGIDRIRVEVRSGAERPTDDFGEFRAGRASAQEWRKTWYDPVNDNADPFLIDSAGFHFGELDLKIREIVLPLRRRLAERGESLYVNLNYVSFNTAAGSTMHRADAEEYAELIVAVFDHMHDRFGFVPDAVEIILEPDLGNDPWTPRQIADALLATAERLRAAGYEPDFIAPSTVDMATGVAFLRRMVDIPGVAGVLTDFSYHRYRGASPRIVDEIGRIPGEYGIRTAMLERRGAGYGELHDDLTRANNSAWQQYALAGCSPDEPVGRLFSIDATDPARPIVTPSDRALYFAQYFRWVRRGAVRVDARTNDPLLDPIAFVNTDGRAVVIVKADRARSFSVEGLPAGRYGVVHTTGPDDHTVDAAAVESEDVVVLAGQRLDAAIPGRGVITIRRKDVADLQAASDSS